MKTLAVLDVGGTISCSAKTTNIEFYSDKGESINSFLNEFCFSGKINFIYEYFYNQISHELSSEQILNLSTKIQNLANDPNIFGIVVSIGTNALEDIAFLVQLIVKTSKTIVFTGAFFPQNSLCFDGKKNLFNACIVAQSALPHDIGVVVTFNDAVISARWATKARPGIPHDFSNQSVGVLGYVVGEVFHLNMHPVQKKSKLEIFSITKMQLIPKIGIVYAHLGMDLDYIEYLSNNENIKGIISAGFGKGYQNKETNILLSRIIRTKHIPIVRCTRTGLAISNRDLSHDDKYGFIVSSQLSPHKASILLSVCVAHELSINEIQKIFEEY